jgi:hypothetical protein
VSNNLLTIIIFHKDKIPWISEEWTPLKAGISEVYSPTDEQVSAYRAELDKFFQDGDSVGRFTQALKDRYKVFDSLYLCVICTNEYLNTWEGYRRSWLQFLWKQC